MFCSLLSPPTPPPSTSSEMQEPPDSPHPHTMMSSDEVDWLVYSYLQESGEWMLSSVLQHAGRGKQMAGVCLCLCSLLHGLDGLIALQKGSYALL